LREVHRLRASVDAILTGSGTVAADDPHLGVRLVPGKSPLRIILDTSLKIPLSSAVFRDEHVLVVCGSGASNKKSLEFRKRGVELICLPEPISLKHVLSALYERGVYSILVEAGSTLVTALLRERLVDRYIQFVAPKLLGGIHCPTSFEGEDPSALSDALRLEKVTVRSFDQDVMVDGYLRFY
jgi:diaminohydroxyphosphoribosylaminopyrimidine deaminase/5-amino-6-(5-phosphoribosylamino)uracil reductase